MSSIEEPFTWEFVITEHKSEPKEIIGWLYDQDRGVYRHPNYRETDIPGLIEGSK
jgi:hypothetical protein